MPHTENPAALALSAAFLELATACTLALRASTLTKSAVFAVQAAVVWGATGALTVGDPYGDFGVGTCVYGSALFTAAHFFFLADPFANGTRHAHDTDDPRARPFLARVWWVLCLRFSIRGVGWTNQNSHIPTSRDATYTRPAFVTRRLLAAAAYFVLLDLAGLYTTHNPLTSSDAARARPLSAQGPLFWVLNVLAWWATMYGSVQMYYSLGAAVGVALGMWEPSAWPPFFGRFRDLYTLRQTWSTCWHHILRRLCVSYGKAVTRVLAIRPHTNASSYTQLYIAFLVSGLVHAVGDRMAGQPFGLSVPFFLLQALAVTFEDGVVALGRRAGVKENVLVRVIGYTSTIAWLVLTTPLLTLTVTGAGKPLAPLLPVSPIKIAYDRAGLNGTVTIPWPTS